MFTFKRIFSLFCVLITSFSFAQDHVTEAVRQGSAASSNFSAASANSIGSVAHGIAASGQVTSAVLAVPLASGAAVLGTAANVSANAASSQAPIGTPLKVTDETVTIMSPSEALSPKNKKSNANGTE